MGERIIKKIILRIVWSLIFLCLVFILVKNLTLLTTSKSSIPLPELDNVPDFTLNTLDGKEVALSNYKGNGMMINFWASWCSPCKKEMPAIENVYNSFKEKGFEVLAINLGEKEERIVNFLEKYPLSYPILLDDDIVSTDYMVHSLPTSYFVEPDGSLNKIHIGELSEEELYKIVSELLTTD